MIHLDPQTHGVKVHCGLQLAESAHQAWNLAAPHRLLELKRAIAAWEETAWSIPSVLQQQAQETYSIADWYAYLANQASAEIQDQPPQQLAAQFLGIVGLTEADHDYEALCLSLAQAFA